jgi:hypothetical protein
VFGEVVGRVIVLGDRTQMESFVETDSNEIPLGSD